jgi:hypothetical protein
MHVGIFLSSFCSFLFPLPTYLYFVLILAFLQVFVVVVPSIFLKIIGAVLYYLLETDLRIMYFNQFHTLMRAPVMSTIFMHNIICCYTGVTLFLLSNYKQENKECTT